MIVEVEGVPLHLAHPDELPVRWVGQEEVMRQLLAAWLVLDAADLPMNPRLLGKPGVGKTTLAYAAAQRLGLETYIMQATVDTRPEDLIVTPVIEGAGKLRYVASPIVSAMLRGGIAILDEGNRMSEKSWASLAPLLDNRRYVESIVSGIKIRAHPSFRMVATMNDDASTFDLPEYIHSRLQPSILIDFPEREEELQILKENLPFGEEEILQYVTDFLQQAHSNEERYSARDGINIARYAMKLMRASSNGLERAEALHTAILETLGGEALRYVPGAEPFDPGSLRRGHIVYFPVAPGRVEFAVEVRRAILRMRPGVVAVELPVSLEKHYLEAVRRLPEISVLVCPDDKDEDRGIYVPIEPADPFTEAIRTALEIGSEVLFIEPDLGDRPHLSDLYPDPYALRRIPLARYVEAYRLWPQPRTDEIAAHAAGIAWKLQGTDPDAEVLAVVSLNLLDPVLDSMETPQEPPPRRLMPRYVDLVNAHPDCLAEITIEYPFLQERYERYRAIMGDEALVDRPRTQFALLREAEASYKKNTGDETVHWQRRMIARYTRNLAHLGRDLTASVFDITIAARSIVDDNFAWEVWTTANRYPAQREVSELETVNLSGEEVWIRTRKLRLRRRLPRPKQRLKPASLKARKKEKTPGEWARSLTGNAICSYPPEDIVIEDYGQYLKKKAKSILSEERLRIEPFLTSILDGIDIRETIRHWHEGRIYVRNLQKMAGEVGAVVVVFDPDESDRYPYLTTWLGEHQNESDMAFYATDPFEHIVGPGIGRAEYGGFLMTRPPRRMYDVWSDTDYEFAESKPERLLLAGLDYSLHPYVVYVAAKPPRSIFRSISSHLGRRILYVPIGQLSSPKLKRLRVVHVLDSYERRETAKDYIW